jgi:hypothetical protein
MALPVLRKGDMVRDKSRSDLGHAYVVKVEGNIARLRWIKDNSESDAILFNLEKVRF